MSNEMNLPWNVYRINSIRGSIIDSERSTVTNHIDPARAAHIVRAVNSHDALVSALTRIVNEPKETLSDGKALREILRIAKGALEHYGSTE